MRKFTIMLFLFLSTVSFGNEIDDLTTTSEVVEFVKTVYPKFREVRWKDFKPGIFDIKSVDSIFSKFQCAEIFEMSEIKSWEKVDINNDGETDLLFISHFYGYTQNIVIAKPNNEYKLIRHLNNFDECEYVKPIKVQGRNELKVRKVDLPFLMYIENISKYVKVDTLTYVYDSFIELNSKPNFDSQIKSVQFKTNLCFGICPVYEITLFSNGNADFKGIEQVRFQGNATKKINKNTIDEIFNLLNYIEVQKLDDYYEVNYTDAATVNLTVFFENGTVKTIKDYGMSGSYGLSALYAKLSKIATETEWK